MRSMTVMVFVAAITGVFYVFAFTGVVAPIAHATLLLVPTIFTVSLVVGFLFRVRSWFE